MANPCPTSAHPGSTPDPELVRSENVANDPSIATEAGTDTVDEPAVQVAVTYPQWRRDELARKYSDDEPREPRSSFYHPYG